MAKFKEITPSREEIQSLKKKQWKCYCQMKFYEDCSKVSWSVIRCGNPECIFTSEGSCPDAPGRASCGLGWIFPWQCHTEICKVLYPRQLGREGADGLRQTVRQLKQRWQACRRCLGDLWIKLLLGRWGWKEKYYFQIIICVIFTYWS